MKNKLFLIFFLGFTLLGFSQNTLIPDPNFEQALIDLGYDNAPINGSVPTANINEVTLLEVSDKNISSLDGIEAFTALNYLSCNDNQLTSLDVTNNAAMIQLNCSGNQLIFLDVSQNTTLTDLVCNTNQLTSLNISQNAALTDLVCTDNQLTSLNLSNNAALTYLEFQTNQLTSLDVSQNTNLTYLNCINNQLTSLDVSNNTALTYLTCRFNQLTSLNMSNNTALTALDCINNPLESLDVRNGNNTNFNLFYSTFNPDLICIFVDDASYSAANWTNIDPASTFVNNEAECEALSLGDNSLVLEVNIYPNPTDDYLFIEGNKNPISISIYNLLGAEVISKRNTHKINVSELSNGVYIIRISDGIGQTNRKFIKN